jgi:hypothetical protein
LIISNEAHLAQRGKLVKDSNIVTHLYLGGFINYQDIHWNFSGEFRDMGAGEHAKCTEYDFDTNQILVRDLWESVRFDDICCDRMIDILMPINISEIIMKS